MNEGRPGRVICVGSLLTLCWVAKYHDAHPTQKLIGCTHSMFITIKKRRSIARERVRNRETQAKIGRDSRLLFI